MNILQLDEACESIKRACEDESPQEYAPFFFLVGAGTSFPSIPLSKDIIRHCKTRVGSLKKTADISDKDAMNHYSHWLTRAYPHSIQRQKYLRGLIEGKPIPAATLRLAHLLLEKNIANIVVTPNFDDFISRSLTLFGRPHIACDHPLTVDRIDAERKDLQIVHVHGTYWFYDCCNLSGEIKARSEGSVDTVKTMSSLLDRILFRRAPLVVGYAGWEQDVVMTALKRRLESPLPYNLYWFCFSLPDVELLPNWLTSNQNVFVVPPSLAGSSRETGTGQVKSRGQASLDPRTSTHSILEEPSGTETETSEILPAQQVFDQMIRTFDLPAPELTRDPLGFFARSLDKALVGKDSTSADKDLYHIRGVIDRLERAKENESLANADEQLLEAIRDLFRRSQYREVISQVNLLGLDQLDHFAVSQLKELIDTLFISATALGDNSEEELIGYDLVDNVHQLLKKKGAHDVSLHERTFEALHNKAVTLWHLNRAPEAIAIYDELLARYGTSTDPPLQERVAKMLCSKGATLALLNRASDAIVVYDDLLRRYEMATELALREWITKAMFNKGMALAQLDRAPEAIAVYDELVGRYGAATEPALQEPVVKALFNKARMLAQLDRAAEAIAVYDELVGRYGMATEPALQERVARALYNKAIEVGQLGRDADEIAIYDELVARYGTATEPALQEQVAKALLNKGTTLDRLDRVTEEIAVYDELVRRYGAATEVPIQEQVARALYNKAMTLTRLDRASEAIAVYDELVHRYGTATELALQEHVAKALMNKGLTLGQLNRYAEEMSTYDELVQRYGTSTELALLEPVAKAQYYKAVLLRQQGQKRQALLVCEDMLKQYCSNLEPGFEGICEQARILKGKLEAENA